MNWSEFKKNKMVTVTYFLTRKVNSSYRQSTDNFFGFRRGKYTRSQLKNNHLHLEELNILTEY